VEKEKFIRSDYKTELEKNNVIAFVPGGNSMWPILKNRGQSVIVERKTQRLKPLDVAFYTRANGAFVLHRVMEVKEDGYVMCGDSQLRHEPVLEENVFGVMTAFYDKDKLVSVTDERYVKRVKKWYGKKIRRKIRLKFFYLKNRIKRLFSKKDKK